MIKAVVRRKFIALNAFIKNFERSHTSNFIAHQKALAQKEANTSKRNRQQETIKLKT